MNSNVIDIRDFKNMCVTVFRKQREFDREFNGGNSRGLAFDLKSEVIRNIELMKDGKETMDEFLAELTRYIIDTLKHCIDYKGFICSPTDISDDRTICILKSSKVLKQIKDVLTLAEKGETDRAERMGNGIISDSEGFVGRNTLVVKTIRNYIESFTDVLDKKGYKLAYSYNGMYGIHFRLSITRND